MGATGFVDACGFIPAGSGTGDFVVSLAVTGYQTPASAGAVNGSVYSYRAQSTDLSQWEEGFGAYTASGTTLARTTVSANSSGNTSKINFGAAPNVFITASSADLANASLISPLYKIAGFTRLLSTASGNQSITGVGFKPRLIQFQIGISGGSSSGSFGQSDGFNNTCLEIALGTPTSLYFQGNIAGIQRDNAAGTNYQSFVVASMDADGFTVTWTKVGTPTSTASIIATCFK